MPYTVDFSTVWTALLESSPVAAALAGLRAERGPLLQEHVRPRLHGGACEQRRDYPRLGAPDPEGRTRHRHLLPPSAGYGLPDREHPNGLRLLRERFVGQRDVHRRRPTKRRSGSSSPKGWKSTPSSPPVQVRQAESRSWPEPSAVPTSTSRTSTDPALRGQSSPAGRVPRRGVSGAAACWRAGQPPNTPAEA
jgi:hypothetical protein